MTQLNVEEPDDLMRQRLWERVGDNVLLLLDIVLCGRSPLGSAVSMTGVATSTTTQSLQLVSQDISVA